MTPSLQAKTEYLFGITMQGIRVAKIEEVEAGFNNHLESISKDKNYLLKIKVFKSEEQVASLLLENKISGYFGSPLLAIKYSKKFNPDLLYTPLLNNKHMQRYLLLVRKDSGINQLKQLKSKSLSYCNSDEVGMMYLQKKLSESKSGAINTFFDSTKLTKNPSLTIFSVFFKETEAAITLESDFEVAAELNPQLKQQLIAIEISPDYITSILAVTSHLEGPMTGTELNNVMQNVNNAMKKNGLLKSYNTFSNLHKIKSEDLNNIRDLINSINLDKTELNR